MNDLVKMLGRLSSALLIAPILAYRYTLSPLLGPRCRFAPSCSEYAIEAIRLRGPLIGLWLGACRMVRCHPFGGSGYDPVPVPGGEAVGCKGGTAPVQSGPAIRQKA